MVTGQASAVSFFQAGSPRDRRERPQDRSGRGGSDMATFTRREWLILAGRGPATAAALGARPARTQAPLIRQGYQTNMRGMPTYYLLRSGHLEKRGLKIEEFSVPSGNLTMQQMVARQVDLGTYAGQSFVLGHDKGKL